ncbi:MAG: ATP-binding protein [Firmicutes bacterium]|nr:ATP-binding protein [Bacillota bacterium]
MENQGNNFGAALLDNITTGMYSDSFTLYREYIQNSCDSIDKAIDKGLLSGREEGEIEIWVDDRTVSIKDNGAGIASQDFEKVLSGIGDSNKVLNKEKGFRGIGRLIGVAYCDKLIFTSKAKGEPTISEMVIDAANWKRMQVEHRMKEQRYSAQEVIQQSTKVQQYECQSVQIDKHWFEVKLSVIDESNSTLLDTTEIRKYLEFNAPVAYKNTFHFRDKISKEAQKYLVIDEYPLFVNREQVFKPYTKTLHKEDDKGGQPFDELVDVSFKELKYDNQKTGAFIWVGIREDFNGVLPASNESRGLRIRKGNIQIGNSDILQSKKLFKEDRGNHYFVGEIFVLDDDLIPNARRDYFESGEALEMFERACKKYFNEDLQPLYKKASELRNAQKRIDKVETVQQELESLKQEIEQNESVDESTKEQKIQEVKEQERVVEKAKSEARSAQTKITKILEKERGEDITPALNMYVGHFKGKLNDESSKSKPDESPKQYGTTNRKSASQIQNESRVEETLKRMPKAERRVVIKIFDILDECRLGDLEEPLKEKLKKRMIEKLK